MFLKSLYIKIIFVVYSQQTMPKLMMKDIHISEISNAEFLVNDDDNGTFDKIIYNYINIHTNKDIAKIWLISYIIIWCI